MAHSIADMIHGFTERLAALKPDLLLLLGDRGEMLAGAIAAIHQNVPIIHIHGGERSGTVDEPIRHAISKLSHYHFVSTGQAAERLVKMGEKPDTVFTVGAPGLDGLTTEALHDRTQCASALGFDADRPMALMVFHPVLQQQDSGRSDTAAIISSLLERQFQTLILLPNADAGRNAISEAIAAFSDHPDVRTVAHLERPRFLSWMANADLMIGNSSSGIIEAASFGTPVINVGSRQNLRERNLNVCDVNATAPDLARAIDWAITSQRFPKTNVYGDGQTAGRVAELASTVALDATVLEKCCAY